MLPVDDNHFYVHLRDLPPYFHNMRALIILALIGSALAQVTPFSAATTRVCGDNNVCQRNGDLQATCASGKCVCADTVNYRTISVGTPAVVYSDCVPAEETAAQSLERKVRSVITITFVNGVCANINNITTLVRSEMLTILGAQTPLVVTSTCEVAGAASRINFGVIADITIGDIYSNAIINFEQNLLTALGASTLSASIGTVTADVSLNTLEGSKSVCPQRIGTIAFGKRATTLDCWAISCSPGYDTLGGELYCTLTAVSTSDDELSGGEKAGIIVGVVGFTIILVIVIYCCCCKKDEEDDDSDSSDESSDEGKPDKEEA